tara:strand:+ start:396 stop:563 length:168 start_codon:yes stop_codon:yes gene_type:complete
MFLFNIDATSAKIILLDIKRDLLFKFFDNILIENIILDKKLSFLKLLKTEIMLNL